jgi:hypothetical protein
MYFQDLYVYLGEKSDSIIMFVYFIFRYKHFYFL